MNLYTLIFFIVFLVFIIGILVLDLTVISRHSHVLSLKESLFWSVIWVSLSLGFYVLVRTHGEWIHLAEKHDVADIGALVTKYQHPINIQNLDFGSALKLYKQNLSLEYLTGYLIEYALSVDNVFVMILIFLAFGVKHEYYKKVLFWGILGAIVMRFLFIFASSALIQKFEWILYVFGLVLLITGALMFRDRNKEKKIDTAKHPVVRFASRYFNVYPRFARDYFWIRRKGKLLFTPLFIVLMVIEFSDVVFAVDSVPAIFSVTRDPYIVFFSNVFAIIGLRSLFFLLTSFLNRLHYLKHGLSVLLVFIGLKMLTHEFYELSTAHSLYIVCGILGVSVLASVIHKQRKNARVRL